MASFGDTRTRDVYNRNVFQAAKPASDSKANKAVVQQVLYGITAADSASTLGADTQFELVKFTATESTADALVGQLDVSVNTGSAGSTKVAELSAANAKFTTAALKADFGSNLVLNMTTSGSAVTQTFSTTASSANDVSLSATSDNLLITVPTETRFLTAKANMDFGSSKTMTLTSASSTVAQRFTTSATVGEDSVITATPSNLDVAAATQIKQTTAQTKTDFGSNKSVVTTTGASSVVQTFTTAAAGVGDVSLTATANNLLVTASNTDFSGEATVRGDRVMWYQDGGSDKRAASSMEYVYVHGDGEDASSTGFMNFALDGQNAKMNLMGYGGFGFKSYNAAGSSETVLAMGAGAAAGQQTVQFSNSYMGINVTPSTTYRLDVGGAARVDGNLSVSGDLYVSGTVTTIDSTTVQVEDKNIGLAYNVTDPALFNGGGITVGSGGSAVTFDYNNDLTAWDANIGINVPTTKALTIAGGVDTTLDKGVTISESGIAFGSDAATIAFGTAAVITKDGLGALSDDFAVTFGADKQWRLKIEPVGGVDYFSMQFSTDGGSTFQTKFSVSP